MHSLPMRVWTVLVVALGAFLSGCATVPETGRRQVMLLSPNQEAAMGLSAFAEIKDEEGKSYRAFVCHTLNAWGYPAKDRSGRLEPIEEPHLGRLMEKIAGPARPAIERLDFARPAPAPTPVSPSTQES